MGGGKRGIFLSYFEVVIRIIQQS
eukprot:COSAG02_NODE_43244_length_376_cov_1.581227_1_plen_23_part_10